MIDAKNSEILTESALKTRSIFDVQSIHRTSVQWENYLEILTPVEQVGELFFKREDYFAPLGYGKANGAKLRQLIFLLSEFRRENENARGLLSGSVSGSPQSAMAAITANHFGLRCVLVCGSKKIAGYRNLEIAAHYGAMFEFSNVGYAKTLEAKVFELASTAYENFFPLETNITVTERRRSKEAVRAFHQPAAIQVQNIPEHIERLIIPCGSAISSTSVLTGIAQYRPSGLKEIVLMGIGNIGSTDLRFLYDRLEMIEKGSSKLFSRPNEYGGEYRVRHLDLNSTGYCRYETLMPFRYHGIDFHPRYEGKCMNFLKQYYSELINPSSLFWIIGSEPSL